jgi:hypothetical protein
MMTGANDNLSPDPRKPLSSAEVTRLADAFAGVLQEWLTRSEWREMRARNATPGYAKCCASHDFCDANMAMAAAFRSALARSPDIYDRAGGEEGPDVELWNAAWDEAARRHLTGE